MSLSFDHHPIHLRRSVLCLPASNRRAIDKLASLEADVVILDLEDAVAEELKQEARDNIRAYLAGARESGREVVIRVNDANSRHFSQDMALVLECEPDAVLLPPGGRCLTDRDVPDGLSNTVTLVESFGCGVTWTEPRDLRFDEMRFVVGPAKGVGVRGRVLGGRSVASAVFADGGFGAIGSSVPLTSDTPPETLKPASIGPTTKPRLDAAPRRP